MAGFAIHVYFKLACGLPERRPDSSERLAPVY